MLNKPGIYKILNWIDGKVYIGSGIRVKHRINNHKSDLRLNKHKNKHLQNAYIKHGEQNFQFIVLEYCEKENIIDREQHWLDITKCYDYNFGYNIATVAGVTRGIVKTLEQLAKHSRAMKGRIRPQAEKDRISVSMKGKQNRLGTKTSEETKQKHRLNNFNKSLEWSQSQSLGQRDFYKWPHELGCRCECRECKDKHNDYRRNRHNKGVSDG